MISKTYAVKAAASIKRTIDRLEAAVADLPAGLAKEAVEAEVLRLHAKLNGVAHKLAEVFDDSDVGVFSGGTGKPAIAPEAP